MREGVQHAANSRASAPGANRASPHHDALVAGCQVQCASPIVVLNRGVDTSFHKSLQTTQLQAQEVATNLLKVLLHVMDMKASRAALIRAQTFIAS